MRTSSAFVVVVAASAALAQTVYHTSPDWESSQSRYGTGGALVDIDQDGWLDLVVANGNDMRREHLEVFYNQGDGTFPTEADWAASDIAYNGHLDVADVNGDGWPDVAVAELGNGSTLGVAAKVYLNNAGTLSSTPDWVSTEIAPAFGAAFGDVNGDGRPDLAVATGWAYGSPHLYHNLVYMNIGGALETTASWQSADTFDTQGAIWVDAEGDGDLDLVLAGSGDYSRMYRNVAGTLESTSSWTNDGPNQDAIMVASGDATGDGVPDLVITDNTQLGGSGRFRLYQGFTGGDFETSYSWSYYDGYGSAVAMADIDRDGDLDLATGAWWDHTRLFYNTGTGYNTSPDWNSAVTSVVEKIIFGDIDNLALRTATDHFPADGRTLVYLSRQPIQRIVAVRADGVVLSPDQYTFHPVQGWVSVASAPASSLDVEYVYSKSLDMAITNWDSGVGNYVYYNQLPPPCEADFNGDGTVNSQDFIAFLNAFTAGDPSADFNEDGTVNSQDFIAFLNAFVAGC